MVEVKEDEKMKDKNLENDIHDLVSEKLIMPMLSEKAKKDNRTFGIKMLLITLIFLLIGVLLLFSIFKSKNMIILKVIGLISCIIFGLFFGVTAYAVLTPPKNVNYFGKFKNK